MKKALILALLASLLTAGPVVAGDVHQFHPFRIDQNDLTVLKLGAISEPDSGVRHTGRQITRQSARALHPNVFIIPIQGV